ncbi:MAG: nucleotidyltransferase substrate binding protein [Deltaproteobacteria bacterium]|nr:nucleotidyltransferase substrate binding protein [Deltaproteobacteria bacterium]
MNDLDLTALKKALTSLEDILNQPLSPYIRDGVIQRFEYTFELAWKIMQRALKLGGVDTGSAKQAFRAAHKAGYIDDVATWMRFLASRNLTSHTYNEDTADEVYQEAVRFPYFVKKLIIKLQDDFELNLK